MRTPVLSSKSLDWESADYKSKVQIEGDTLKVEHNLYGSEILNSLLEAQYASWAVEVRSPYTLYSHSEYSSAPLTEIALNATLLGSGFYIRPMLCARVGFELETRELSPSWQTYAASLPISQGTVLAEDDIWVDSDIISNIFRYDVMKNTKLKNGELEVKSISPTSHPPYVVYINEVTQRLINLENTTASQSIGIAALTAVFGMLVNELASNQSSGPENEAAQELFDKVIDRLSEDGWTVRDWGSFDCLAAATTLHSFPVDVMLSEIDRDV